MMAAISTTQVLLVDDHSVVRAGIRTMIEHDQDIEIVGEAESVGEAVSLIHRERPDVVLLDVRLPDGNGFEVIREIKKTILGTKFIVLTAFDDDQIVREAINAGTDGFLLKEIDGAALAKAVRTVASGKSVLDPTITGRVLGQYKDMSNSSTSSPLSVLSPQESRVLHLVADGKTNKEIGLEMGLSDKTVKNYLRNLMEKLNLSRRSEAAAFYVRHSRQD